MFFSKLSGNPVSFTASVFLFAAFFFDASPFPAAVFPSPAERFLTAHYPCTRIQLFPDCNSGVCVFVLFFPKLFPRPWSPLFLLAASG